MSKADQQLSSPQGRMRGGLVSIMMPAFNAAAFIGQAVESVLQQSEERWELIVVDDGSTDDTAQVIAGFNDPRIRVIHQTNQGEARARNVALGEAQGEFLAFVDADDRLLPSHIGSARRFLMAHPEYQAVYTDGYYIDEQGRRQGRLSGRRRGPFEGDLFEEFVRASDVLGPPTCAVLCMGPIRNHRLSFDPQIVIGPDWDFFRQFAEIGQFGYVEQATCEYRVHGSNITLMTRGLVRRASLARCREKAIASERFSECSIETRSYVFYDLMINLSESAAERASRIEQAAFASLPATERSRLLRLMASQAILHREDDAPVDRWLETSAQLDPASGRSRLLRLLHSVSPAVCRLALGLRRIGRRNHTRSHLAFAR